VTDEPTSKGAARRAAGDYSTIKPTKGWHRKLLSGLAGPRHPALPNSSAEPRKGPFPAISMAHRDLQTGEYVKLDFYTPTEAIRWLEEQLKSARVYQASEDGKLLEAARMGDR
jgi:hypothetical protein